MELQLLAGNGQPYAPRSCHLWERATGALSLGGWVGTRSGLDNLEEFPFHACRLVT